MTAGLLSTALGPGQGIFGGGDIIVVCRNQVGSALTLGQAGLFDVGLLFATTAEEGGALGTSAFNTIVDTDEPTTLNVAFDNAGIIYIPAALSQEPESLADGADGRFLVRGQGFANWVNAQAIGESGQVVFNDNDLRTPIAPSTGMQYGKIVAITQVAAPASGLSTKSWVDGWNGFGNGNNA